MRIIAGKAGGIRLRVPPGRDVRPTTDRVKESLFGSLGPLQGQVVADVFCGTGALGLEALSRGAAEVLFVERDRTALRVMEENLAHVRKAMGGEGGEVTILRADVARLAVVAGAWKDRCDVILADPPYRPPVGGYGADALLRDAAFAEWAGDALLILEHAAKASLPWNPLGPWRLLATKRQGTISVSRARCAAGFLSQ